VERGDGRAVTAEDGRREGRVGEHVEVEVRYFAGAAAAAGAPGERVRVPAGASVADLLDRAARDRPGLPPVLAVASVLVDEVAVTDRSVVLADGARVDVLPPFAGG
jgi:sulfur-carrier protein